MIFAEIAGELVGYGRGWWWDEPAVGRIYGLVGFLVPAWRRKGIGRAMLVWLEQRLHDIAMAHSIALTRFFQANVSQFQAGTAILLERMGYQPARYFYEMVRPNLEDILDWPLPEGIEIRPALPEHYRAIWVSVDEASQDEWGYTGEDYETWLNNITPFQPQLWQIAWDIATGQVVGHVLTFIDEAQNIPLETLENLRMLSNLETPKDKLIEIVLVVQPELLRLLNLRELRQVKQRIAIHSDTHRSHRVRSWSILNTV